VILASPVSVTNNGAINASGGSGGSGGPLDELGGGGGRGIVHFLSPSITTVAVTVIGGAPGTSALPNIAINPHAGGGAGGACGGDGGSGGQVDMTGVRGAANPGTKGYLLQTPVDPTSLF
jgi:hypothetical protein